MENVDITTLRQSIEDMRADLNEQITRINGLAALLETALVQATKIGIGMPEEDVEGPNGIVKEKKAPEAALDVRGHLNTAADPPRIYATNSNPNSDNGQYLQLTDGSNRSSAYGLKAGGVLVSDAYNYANPPAGNLIVKGKVGIGTPDPTNPLHVKGNATITGEISEGDKTLKEKYQQKGDYYKKGDSIAVVTDSTDAKKIDPNVKKTTASVELEIVGEDKATKEEPIGARIRIGGNRSNVVTSGFRIDRASRTLLKVTHGGDLELPEGGSLKIGDVTITVEPVELYSKEVGEVRRDGFGLRDGSREVSIRQYQWFLTAPASGTKWVPMNKPSVALVLRKKGQEPIVIGMQNELK